jgi:FMN phosphatase YigB (HAD superfamily)
MTVKAVLFDLDETLFDFDHSRHSGAYAVHSAYACFAPYTFTRFDQDLSALLHALWPQVMDRTLTVEGRIVEALRRLTEQYGLEADWEGMAAHYRDAYQQARRTVAGAIPLLEILKPQVTIGIVTNHQRDEQLDKLRVCKLDPWIAEARSPHL